MAAPNVTRPLPKRMHVKHGRYYHLRPKPAGGYDWIALSQNYEEALTAHRALVGAANGEHLPPADGAPAAWIGRHVSALLRQAKMGAARRNILFALTRPDIIAIGSRSNWRCAVTGLRFSAERIGAAHMRPYMPSIDRVDCAGGYVPDNCRMVCTAINLALNDWGEGVFAALARAYLKLHADIGVRHAGQKQTR